MKSALPHVTQSTQTHSELDFENTLSSSSSQNSNLIGVGNMSSEDESSSSEEVYKIRRRSKSDRRQRRVLRKLNQIEKTQHLMVEYLSKVNDQLEKLEIPLGPESYPNQRRVKLDIRMIKMLQNLEQGSVTEQERKKIDKLVRDMKSKTYIKS